MNPDEVPAASRSSRPSTTAVQIGTRPTSAREFSSAEAWTIAIDVGGTFTDAVAVSTSGQLRATKVPSSPDNPADGFLHAIRELGELGVPLGAVKLVFHGTTVATNAVITGRMARTVLVTTAGFRDVLSYRSGARPDVYDLRQARPDEFVDRADRIEVEERLSADGHPLVALAADEIDRVGAEVVSRKPEAVAICLLFSYMDGTHERLIADRLASLLPRMPISVSSAVAQEHREYPRTITTVINAGLRPIVGSYLLGAKHEMDALGMSSRLLVMQSNGGGVPAERAEREAHRLLLSGPAAGVAGAVALGAQCGLQKMISLDMGGTSVDVCLIQDGVPPVVPIQRLGVHPVLSPSVDIFTAGAGGGSIVEVDEVGRLRVGPRSAGADPGPVAYGRGGKDLTLTDAHLVAGTLGNETTLAGRLRLDADSARSAVEAVAERIGLDIDMTAEGIIALATAHLEGAIRRVSVERGEDPRDYALVAFGGAGPLHAGQLVRDLELPMAIIPRQPGLFSATGLLAADLRVDDSRTVLRILEEGGTGELEEWFRQSQARIIGQLEQDGVARQHIRVISSIDCRYLGQGYELSLPLASNDSLDVQEITELFHRLHSSVYGHRSPEDPVEAVTIRSSGFGGWEWNQDIEVEADPGTSRALGEQAIIEHRPVRFRGESNRILTPIFTRDGLTPGSVVAGPAIIEQIDTTTVVLPGQNARIDAHRNMWLKETPE